MDIATLVRQVNAGGFHICAATVCLACMYYTFMRSRPEKTQNRMFLFILFNILVSSLVDMSIVMAMPYVEVSKAARLIRDVNQYVYFLFHTLLAPSFCLYFSLVTGMAYHLNKRKKFLFELPMYFTEFLAIINPLTHFVYYFDDEENFVRVWGEMIIYAVGMGYFIATVVISMISWRAINARKKKTLVFFFIFVTVGVLIQFLYPSIHTELFMEAIAMTGVMVTIENEDDRRNPRTGIYNQVALVEDIRTFIAAKRPFNMICLKMLNPQNVMQIAGPMNIEKLTMVTGGYLKSVMPGQNLYYMSPGTFVVIEEGADGNVSLQKAMEVNERFKHEWHFLGRETIFHAAVFCVEVPKDLKSQDQIMALVMSPMIPDRSRKPDVYHGSDLNYILRRSRVEKAIMSGLDNHSFEVFYQPIYDANGMTIHAGEALLRLHDSEIGEIYPDEFLPIAERNGLIFDIGDFVLDEVCKFINSGIPVEMGVETLNVNLSVVQCIQPSYAERIMQIVSRYDIEPCRITFEITESAATTEFDGLESFVKKLRAKGFNFSVDDYGIGYSNVHSIFSLDVDVIKIDRTILWEAEQTDIGRIIMESSTSMIKRMGKKILISGVESQAQIELASEFGVDYLQGFYFSNPISQNEFIGVLKATKLARVEEQRAIAANEAMSNFLANMSHEIRTPINAVLGMDEMIIRESDDERILEYARTIEGAGRTLLSLINDILDFSKIEAGNMSIIESEYELSAVLNDVVNMIQVKADQKELKLLVDVDSQIPERLLGDEMRLRQIMLNILNNAVKYTNRGTVSLQLSYERIDKDNIKLIIAIRDTGIGIKEEDLSKLFSKFQRLDQRINRTVEGSGLGLAIVHNLLELMDGDIDVESTYGNGSKFTVTIPQKVVALETVGDFRRKFNKNNEYISKYKESFQAPDATILVVDDTEMNLVVVRELLKKTKLQVEEAMSGMECINMVSEKHYDLIFLDYRMPVMDGIETLKAMREIENNPNENTPVVALTANAISGAREKFIKEGFDDYMTKPIDGEKLENLLLMYLPGDKIKRSGSGSVMDSTNYIPPQDGVDLTDWKAVSLDTKRGIKNCGSEEIYKTVFEAFKDDIKERLQVLQDAYDKKDWNQYGVCVHAIKSSANIVGANVLGSLARELELAADSGDVAKIRRDNKALVTLYERYLDFEL
ncbi:MAG: EAL domain-containing protein [Lachnospiraceae bacterium]|nr:EAL domain-containing protein [Lachnospiraceae bacterium]